MSDKLIIGPRMFNHLVKTGVEKCGYLINVDINEEKDSLMRYIYHLEDKNKKLKSALKITLEVYPNFLDDEEDDLFIKYCEELIKGD